MTLELRSLWPDAPRFGPADPFPRYRYVSGLHPHPVRDPAGHTHDAPAGRWSPGDTFRRGVDLYHAGYLWEAHEAWEELWKQARDAAERDLLQGLIQTAAALIKVHAGVVDGVRRLAAAARPRLARAPGAAHGFDIARFLLDFDTCFAPVLGTGALDGAWERAPRLHRTGRDRE
jgi:hypothetical protein